MARYRARGPLFLRRLVATGEEFESDLQPGRNWEPLDDEARAAVERFKADNGKVLVIADRIEPARQDRGAVEIPENWDNLTKAKRRGLAMKLGAQSNVSAENADSFIKAEIERRSTKATAA